MKKVLAIALLALTGTVLIAEKDVEGKILNPKEEAILRAISFSGTPEEIREVFHYMKGHMSPRIIAHVKSKLGTNNLSSFLLGLSPLDYDEYEVEDLGKGKSIFEVLSPMKAGKSLVQLEHIGQLNWENIGDKFAKGSFVFFEKKAWRIKCLFLAQEEGSKWIITKLVIVKKSSSEFNDALLVFDLSKGVGEQRVPNNEKD